MLLSTSRQPDYEFNHTHSNSVLKFSCKSDPAPVATSSVGNFISNKAVGVGSTMGMGLGIGLGMNAGKKKYQVVFIIE